MDAYFTLPVLDAEEQRVLGCLMEKSKTTPDYYPMTLNGLTAACNQKSSRKPVVEYDEETVVLALNSLKKRGLISTATGGSSRATKYKHNFAIVYPLIPSELAIICLLLLRGPLTPGEINSNSGRLYEFESLEEVQEMLEKLAGGDIQYVAQLPRRAGQKELRYMHLLGGTPESVEEDFPEEPARRSVGDMETRLSKVEQELADLKEAFDKLMKELMG
ncbi:MAG: hypothetical protein K0S09_855 [Sphingobacteriaceae bacterium]|jgi:uncharacterized protein YceH (UPF0502 family)|nr:hypothetical protein [Sphingobacteriaceae bacterium]